MVQAEEKRLTTPELKKIKAEEFTVFRGRFQRNAFETAISYNYRQAHKNNLK